MNRIEILDQGQTNLMEGTALTCCWAMYIFFK